MLEPDDAGWIARGVSIPAVHKWLTAVPRPYGLNDGDEFVARVKADAGYRAIVEDGAPRGVVSISDRKRDNVIAPELGYWLYPEAWGRGLMSEAAGAMLDWHFAHTDTDLGSGWIKGNSPSEHVLTKLGFEPTGRTLPTMSFYYGHDFPVVRVRMTRALWAKLERAAHSS